MNDSLAPRTAGQMSHHLLRFSCTCGSFSNEGLFRMITDIGHLETMHRDQNIVPMKWATQATAFTYSIFQPGCMEHMGKWDNRLSGSCFCRAREPHGILKRVCGEAKLCSSPAMWEIQRQNSLRLCFSPLDSFSIWLFCVDNENCRSL